MRKTLFLLMFISTTAQASPFANGNADRGSKLYVKYQCSSCHEAKVGGDGSAIAREQQVTTARDLDVQKNNFADKESIAAENAREITIATKNLEEQIDSINAIDAEGGIVGFFKQQFLRPGMVDRANETIALINTRTSMQATLTAQSEHLAAAQTSLMPTKPPQQLATEDAFFTRADRTVHSADNLIVQMERCSGAIGKQLTSQEKQDLAAWLNQRYYHFK